jgi:ornithine decarboxylase
VKCNPDRTLLQTLSQLGAGFDCASGRELMEVADVGYGSECFHKRVVYANPCKPKRDLLKAKALGSPTTVIDSCEEIDKLSEIGWSGSAFIRLLVEDTGSLLPFSRKFGLANESLSKVVDYAKLKGLRLSGVSFHVGSGCHTSEQYKKAIHQSQKALGILTKAGNDAKLIDIGGGFLPTEEQFALHARAIRKGIFGTLQDPYTYIAEPGRFFADGSFDLFVQVIGKKPSLDGQGWRFTIDESLYGQFSCIPFDHKIPTWVRIPTSYEGKDFAPRKKVKGTLFGRTCDSLDMIARSESMEDLEVGDWLWFPNMGAYTSVTASEFNGFPKPPLHGTDSMVLLPSVSTIQSEGFAERFPQQIHTVSPVSVAD